MAGDHTAFEFAVHAAHAGPAAQVRSHPGGLEWPVGMLSCRRRVIMRVCFSAACLATRRRSSEAPDLSDAQRFALFCERSPLVSNR